ncbi:MAG: methylmalonyl Co-A mutase-associated GTPase MeaB [Candidatus Latescibacterota bacterium]
MALIDALMAGDRRALGRAITLAETDSERAIVLYRQIREHTGRARVIGITGPSGAGKSTLINGLITALRAGGSTVAVAAVDPSSPFSGGAILGDRLRMTTHTGDDGVFIRSLSTRGHLGGLTSTVHGVIDILDAAGYERIILETVGTGQSEIEVRDIADTRVVLCTPGMGDDIQAIKAGIFEIADILVVNKADLAGADRTVQDLTSMLALRAADHDRAVVVKTTATTAEGVDELLTAIEHHATTVSTDRAERRRNRTRRLLASRAGDLLRESLLRTGGSDLDVLCTALERRERSLNDCARAAPDLKHH